MTNKLKLRVVFVISLLLVVGLCFGSTHLAKSALRKYDATRLDVFVHRITGADRIVGIFMHSSGSVTIAGDDVQKVVQAVASSSSARPPAGTAWTCLYDVKAMFFKGTNLLGDVELCGPMFLYDGSEPPFRDYTGVLDALVNAPISKAREKEYDAK